MRSRWLRTALAISAALVCSVPLLAQTQFASFTGIVSSKDGNPLPNVDLVATNQATQVAYTAKSNEAGVYTISALPIGTYKVRATAPNFQAYETNPIKLESGQSARVNITMQLGVAENIEVVGVAPILQTQDAVVGEVVSETTIKGMPLNGRNFSQLSLLMPGAISTDPNSFSEPKNFGSGRPNVNGQREQENNYMLDGIDMNEPIDNLLPYQPSPDALAEVRVETNNYNAEFGKAPGAYSAIAYACAQVIIANAAKAIAAGTTDLAALREAVRAAAVVADNKYDTVIGPVSFDKNGDITTPYMSFYKVDLTAEGGKGGWVYVKQQAFTDPNK